MANNRRSKAKVKKPSSLLLFITEHFVAFSAIAFAVAMLASTTFLYAYLAIFDWRLIWLVESTDIVKVGLIALAVLSSFTVFVWTIIDDIAYYATEGKRLRPWMVGVGAIWFVSLCANLFDTSRNTSPNYGAVVSIHLSLVFIAITTWMAFHIAETFPAVRIRTIFFFVFLLTAAVSTFGSTFAHYTRLTKGFERTAYIKNGETVKGGLVMITPRYVVLWSERVVTVLSASDVEKIERDNISIDR